MIEVGMCKHALALLVCAAFVSTAVGQGVAPSRAPKTFDLNTIMMQATFRIEGHTANGEQVLGTGFLMGRPLTKEPGRARFVLITAAHVLNDMAGDNVSLIMRRRSPNGAWQKIRVFVPIRSGAQPLWVHHPQADVAALYVAIPKELVPEDLVSTGLLATDSTLTQFEIHPGDELECLGYPLGYENPGGFPILRSGKIASYPLVPAKENPYFLLDFRVFKGNSGGPVYFVQGNRTYRGATQIGVIQFIMGLVSEEVSMTQQFQGLYENRSETYPLGLAKIVPAAFIVETLNLLPPPD